MRLSEFDFDLHESFIAQNPVKPRDYSKLMVLNRAAGDIVHRHFYELDSFLRAGDVLVINTSKVIPARIVFANKEIFLLGLSDDSRVYECLVKPGKAFPEGGLHKISDNLFAKVLKVNDLGTRSIQFLDKNLNFVDESVLIAHGTMPLPPYIKNSSASFEDYQTVYAKRAGSVAAPTAGLHFTGPLIDKLKAMGVQIVEVMLHVSMGTFMPVKVDRIDDHTMHSEFFELSAEAASILNEARAKNGRIIGVGTTSVRVLESSFVDGMFAPRAAETDIFIYPGYRWRALDGLITNFHLPKSTLLMLVASFAGRDFIMRAYEEAKRNDYRFFSFGDAMLIL